MAVSPDLSLGMPRKELADVIRSLAPELNCAGTFKLGFLQFRAREDLILIVC